jgi:hypothetical protein
MAVEVRIIPSEEAMVPFGVNPDSAARSRDRVHATDVIRYIGQRSGLMVTYSNSGSGWNLYLAGETGFLWERVLSHVFGKEAAERPGEVELDGITGSPDGITVIDGELALEEYKVTWKSSKWGIEENWYWMTQTKAYMKMCGVTLCRFRILYVMGEYRGKGPEYVEALVRWDQKDVDETWEMILRHRDEAWEEKRKGDTGNG